MLTIKLQLSEYDALVLARVLAEDSGYRSGLCNLTLCTEAEQAQYRHEASVLLAAACQVRTELNRAGAAQ